MLSAEKPDLRSETDRTPGTHKSPAERGEFRNIYRRADGSERHGCTWSTREAAELGREVLDGETFVELRDMRNATSMALIGVDIDDYLSGRRETVEAGES